MASINPGGGDANDPARSNPHNLLTIPPEIFEMVALQVDENDLLKLRSVSHEVYQRTQKTFLEAHFTCRTFLLSSEESLRTLLAITEKEEFAAAIKMLDFSAWEICQSTAPTVYHGFWSDRPRGLSLENQLRIKQQREQTELLFKNQTEFRERNRDLTLLTAAFCQLRLLGTCPEIRVVEMSTLYTSPYQSKTLELLAGQILDDKSKPDRAVGIVLEALGLSGLQTELFMTDLESTCIRMGSLIETPRRCLRVEAVFSKLKTLQLMFDSRSYHNGTTQEARGFFQILASASPVLEDLALSVETYTRGTKKANTFKDMTTLLYNCLQGGFSKLKALRIQGFDLSVKQLNTIVENHPALEKIHFHAQDEHSARPPWNVVVDGKHFCRCVVSLGCQWSPSSILVGRLVPSCTMIELLYGRARWEEVLEHMREDYEVDRA